MFEGAHKDARKRPRFALHGSSSGFRLSFAYYWQRFGTLSDEFCFTERKLCVEKLILESGRADASQARPNYVPCTQQNVNLARLTHVRMD